MCVCVCVCIYVYIYIYMDVFCSQDVMELSSKLKGKVQLVRVPFPKFNHIDFLWAKDVYHLVYKNVITSLEKHELDRILKGNKEDFEK